MGNMLEKLNQIIVDLRDKVTDAVNTDPITVIRTFNEIAEDHRVVNIVEFAWKRVKMIAEADLGRLYISNIDLQKQFYKLLEASVRHGGEVDDKVVARFERDIKKAKLGPVLNKRARVEVNNAGNVHVETQWLFDRDTVFDLLKADGIIDGKKFGQMIFDRTNMKVEKMAIVFGLEEFISEPREGDKFMVPLFPKSGANRIVVAKLEDKSKWREAAVELAKTINADKWLETKGHNYKSYIKLGIMLERQGHRITLDDELKFKVVDMPECDGTVVFFREGVVSDMLERMGWNPGIGFQGTLFNVELGMFGKGTFVEVPEVWFKANGIANDVDIVINKDAIVGNAVIDGVEEGVLPANSFLVMYNMADFRPKATLSRQFIEYHWDDTPEAVEAFLKLHDEQMNDIAKGGSMLGYKFARLIDAGLPVNCPVVREEHVTSVAQTLASKMFSINLKKAKLGDSHYIIGINDAAFKKMIARYKVDADPVNVVILPRTSVLAKGKKVGEVFEIGMFKNPVTPTADCPMKYVAVVGTHKGGMLYCHADAPHRVESGHDYDGDAVVIFDGSLFQYLIDKDRMLSSLADIKLEEGGSPEINGLEDIFKMIAIQMDTPVGKFENTLGKLYAVLNFRYSGEYIEPDFDEFCRYAEIAAAQVQGYINAQKKVIIGLLDHDAFAEDVNNLVPNREGWSSVTDSLRTLAKAFKKAVVKGRIHNAEAIARNAKPFGDLMNAFVTDAKKLVEYRKKAKKNTDATIETVIYHFKDKKWKAGVHKFTFKNWLYALIEDASDVERKALVAVSSKYWNAIVTVGNLLNIASTARNHAAALIEKYDYEDGHDKNTLEADLSKANNKLLFVFNLIIRYLAWIISDRLVEEFGIKKDRAELITWVYFGQRLSESAFLNAVEDHVIEALVKVYKEKRATGKIVIKGENKPADPNGGNKKKKKINKKEKAMKKKAITFYTDGSYSTKSNKCGWGYISEDGKIKEFNVVKDKVLSSMRQVGGELVAVVKAIMKAIELGYDEVIIKYDYQGVEDWVTGKWKAKKDATIRYKEKVNELKKDIAIKFIKISGDNNPADEIARMATGAKNAH